MIKYFFKLFFQYEVEKDEDGKPVTSTFDLGLYSTRKKAEERIPYYADKLGFRDYPLNCFHINKVRIKFTDNIQNKSERKLYQLWHEYEIIEKGNTYDICHDFGYFSQYEMAIEEMERLRKSHNIGKQYPNNFEIYEATVDSSITGWNEGFIHWDD